MQSRALFGTRCANAQADSARMGCRCSTRGGGGVQGSGTGVVIGGPRGGEVIVGNVQTNVDEFERAVAIRYKPAQAR